MDSLHLRALDCPATTFLRNSKQFRFVNRRNLSFLNWRIYSSPLQQLPLEHSRKHLAGAVVCAVSSTETRGEEKKKKKIRMKPKSGRSNVRLNVRLDHQVKFGESVVILGSVKELGSWKKQVPMNWSESGWVCDLELKGEESIEYKFVIAKKDNRLEWESGDNRILKLPKGGSFGIVCHWNQTGEAVDLLSLVSQENEEEMEDVGENGFMVTGSAAEALPEVGTSTLVEQWQGQAASFMRSNEHRNQETERKWDTSGLKGFSLKLIEGDCNARNWWRKIAAGIDKAQFSA